jgi:hypothetical protein
LRPNQHFIHCILVPSTQRIKRQGREADHSPPSSVEDKNGRAITPLPHTSSWCGAWLIKHRDNFVWEQRYTSVPLTVFEPVAPMFETHKKCILHFFEINEYP